MIFVLFMALQISPFYKYLKQIDHYLSGNIFALENMLQMDAMIVKASCTCLMCVTFSLLPTPQCWDLLLQEYPLSLLGTPQALLF